MGTFERQTVISNLVERAKNGTIDFDAATIIIDGLTDDEREKLHDIFVVEAVADQLCEGRQRYDLNRLVRYINERKPNEVYNTQSETTPQPVSDIIINALPAMYDFLIEEKVISDKTDKIEFINIMVKGGIPTIAKKTKFRAFIKHIKPYFNKCWYDAVCRSANLSKKEMGKLNGERTIGFERSLCKIIETFDCR